MPADLSSVAHRPWELPGGEHAMEMSWHDLLFAHWPVELSVLRGLLPGRLEIDCWEGEAWIGVVPFRMTGVRPRGFPLMPGASEFPEINVRTYVTEGGKPGVFFFSLDAASALAVAAARVWYHLPYYYARMSCDGRDGVIHYSSRRVMAGGRPAEFVARYGPVPDAPCQDCGELARWLTERYCLYSFGPRGALYRADIHHALWPLQPAWADIGMNTMTAPLGLTLPDKPPLLHFASRLDVAAWNPRRICG